MKYRLSQVSVVGITISLLLGLLILLIGMRVVSLAFHGVWASIIDVVFIVVGLLIICYNTGINKLVGERAVTTFVVVISIITLFSLWFGCSYVYTFYEDGKFLSSHDEHNLTYLRILDVADQLNEGSFSDAYLLALTYGQYAYSYLYSSLMYVFGGNMITHMCVWNGMHLGIMAILSLLVANASGITDRKALKCVLFMVVLQPIFWTLSAYNRNIVGECFLLLGLFIFVKVADKPLKSLAFLPIYGFLFYAYRLQYLLIAISLFLMFSLVPQNRRNSISFIGLFLSFGVILYLVNSFDWAVDVGEGLNVDNYVEAANKSIISSILLGLIGKFPWTNVFFDSNWTYHLFVSLQAPMMLVLYYYSYILYKNQVQEFLFRPVSMCALLLLLAGMISSTHTTYLAVAAPMLIIGVSDIGTAKLEKSYFRLSIVFIILSLAYFALGLTGTGMISH